MLLLLGESKGNKKKTPFHFEKAITSIHGSSSPSPFLLFLRAVRDIKREMYRRDIYSPSCVNILPAPLHAMFPSEGKDCWLLPAKMLIPLCIPKLLVSLTASPQNA
jgi:hypothetical protein